MDVQEGPSVVHAMINRAGRSDVIPDRGVRTGLGQVEFRDGGVGGDAQGTHGCPPVSVSGAHTAVCSGCAMLG
jgi:hypothetical protein